MRPVSFRFYATAMVMLTVLASLLLMFVGAHATRAQSATITQFPGATVTVSARPGRTTTRSLTTTCPAGMFAVAGGWSIQGAAPVDILESFPSQLPGLGAGEWTITVRVAGGTIQVTPYVTCMTGEQLPE